MDYISSMFASTQQSTAINVEYCRPKLYKKQETAFFNSSRYSMIEGSTKCFVAGTLVKTDKGHKPIETIQAGDMALSWDGHEYIYKPVLKRFDNKGSYAMIRCITRHGIIEATQDHEFRTNTGWDKIINIAKRAMDNKRKARRSLLCEQYGAHSINQIQGYQKQVRHIKARTRCKRLSAHDALSQWEIQNNQDSQDYSGSFSWPYSQGYDSPSQEFQSSRQQNRKPRAFKYQRQHTKICKSRKIWKFCGSYKRQFEAYGRAGFSHKGRIHTIQSSAKGFSKKIRRKSFDYSQNIKSGKLEARIITEEEILSYELYEFKGTLYDICVEETHNYCITEENISVHNSGKTHGALAWLAEQAIMHGKSGRNFWWVAPVYGQAKIAFQRMKRAIPPHLYTKNESEMTMTLFNGAVIVFKSGERPDNLYGEDVYAAVIDEASRLREESWHAVRSTLTATRGPLRAVGNVKGRKNWFFKLCRRAQANEKNFFYDKITAYDAVAAGVLDAEEIEDAKRALPESVFKELYLAEPAADEGNPFGIKHIEACYKPDAIPDITQKYGFDLAKTYDWAVLLGLDDNGVESYFDRWQGDIGGSIRRVDNEVKGKVCAVDATGMGMRPAEEFQAISENYIPYTFTASSKQLLMEALALAIQRQEITIRSEIIKNELDSFEYEFTRGGVRYSAPEGYHDDCVIALALANYAKGNKIHAGGFMTI